MSGGTGIWALVLHGGAKAIPPERAEAKREGCRAALRVGASILRGGGTALDAVEATIRILEDDAISNAGRGSARRPGGETEMDAAMMDGATLDLGGVAALRGVRHPVSVARLMLREAPTLLVAEGARHFAEMHGAELDESADLPMLGDAGHDTVGCVALDGHGHLAAGTSTGGLEGSMAGRVGDSALPGCGLYADDLMGAVAFSGDGENIARTLLAARVMQALEEGSPQAAAELAMARLRRVGGEAGGIVLDRAGHVGWAHNSPHFAVGIATSEDGILRTYLWKGEELDLD
ncbi:isoaspartyl peptidase/L-asparaginase family protein [Muricoccus roseus]|nr:isoaspartyl peptidase/L-asparaginase family protein [Roseomonas rosea]